MKHEKQVLTDFSEQRWADINIDSVRECVKKLAGKELIGHDGHCNTTVETHRISNVLMEENIVYGDVEFLNSEIAREREKQYLEGLYRFSVEASGNSNKYTRMVESLSEIDTWDIVKTAFRF